MTVKNKVVIISWSQKYNEIKLRKLQGYQMNDISCHILPRKFYGRDTSKVARDLLGKALVKYKGSEMVGGIITETEAYYGPDDPASHAYHGKTPRSRIMFGKPGIAYVYLCYGMYNLLNIVTENEDRPGAVLIRALSPVWGTGFMEKRRNLDTRLTDGPGKLTIALGIDITDNGADIVNGEKNIYIFDYKSGSKNGKIMVTGRIGIKEEKERPLRFYIKTFR